MVLRNGFISKNRECRKHFLCLPAPHHCPWQRYPNFDRSATLLLPCRSGRYPAIEAVDHGPELLEGVMLEHDVGHPMEQAD
jgi:hypothetical protein